MGPATARWHGIRGRKPERLSDAIEGRACTGSARAARAAGPLMRLRRRLAATSLPPPFIETRRSCSRPRLGRRDDVRSARAPRGEYASMVDQRVPKRCAPCRTRDCRRTTRPRGASPERCRLPSPITLVLPVVVATSSSLISLSSLSAPLGGRMAFVCRRVVNDGGQSAVRH
jgi:hypothetical protein